MNSSVKLRNHLCILDVGHGNAAALIANDQVVLIDVGKHSAVAVFLDEQQISKVKSIYLSHADDDHIGALIGLLGTPQLSIDRVFLNTDSAKGSKIWDDLLYELNSAHRRGAIKFQPSVTAEHTEQLTGQVSIQILGPSPYLAAKGPGSTDSRGQKIRTNSVSAVVAVLANDKRLAILPGDLDSIGLADLRDNKADLTAPILVYPHHGGLPGSSNPLNFASDLLEAIAPEKVVFSIGRGRYSTPNPLTIDALRAVLPEARIVCTQLSEHCSSELPPKDAPKHLTDVFAQGRDKAACCGGSIVIPLGQPSLLWPEARAHESFIGEYAKSSLCVPVTQL